MRCTVEDLPTRVAALQDELKKARREVEKVAKAAAGGTLELFYTEMGWDVATGAPTRARLTALGMADVATMQKAVDALEKGTEAGLVRFGEHGRFVGDPFPGDGGVGGGLGGQRQEQDQEE